MLRACRVVDRAQVVQDTALNPASNRLIRDSDLLSINCAYLLDYDVIVCQNLHNGKICGYGIPLASLFPHCWGPFKGKDLSARSDRIPHQIRFCKKGQCYTPIQKQFIQRLLARHPNIVVSVAEMRDLRIREDQYGPIAHIGSPIPGYLCNYCDYAIGAVTDGPEPLSMREHWQQHRRVSPEQPSSIPRGCDLRRSKEFQACSVQSFDRDRCNALWLSVPPGPEAEPMCPQKSFGQLLSGQQLPLQSCLPFSGSPNRIAILPFFSQNGAYDLIKQLDPSEIIALIQLPHKGECGFQDLKMAVVKRFEGLCSMISGVPNQVRELLVAPKP